MGKIAKTITDMAAELAKKKRAVLPKEEADANLKKFLDQSKVQQRLYHGTTATEGGKGAEAIRRFKPSKEGALGSGSYLTPQPDRANLYTRSSRPDAGGNVLPVYAQLKNPLVIEGTGDPMVEALIKLGMDEQKASRMVDRAYENKGYIGKEVESRARAAGYDGLMQYRDGELAEVVSYNPNAIKSAIGNIGTYDTSVPELSKAHGGAVKMQDGGAAETFNEAMLRRTRKFSPTDIDQMRREIAENARRIAAERQARAEDQPPAEMKPYEPTLQQKLGAATERGLRAIGAPANRARELSGVLTGGSTGSPLPLGMSVMDFTPAAIPVYGGQGVINAANAAGQGNYGEAALELGLAALDLSTAIPATKALAGKAKPMVKAGAKALAPKAGELAEQYMMRTGMALPMADAPAKGRKVDPVRAEREAAMERARINAVKMLGLPENNTAMDRAKAMGYEPDNELYHGSLHDIKRVNIGKGEPTAFAGQGFYMTPNPKDASMNYASIYGPDVSGKIDRGIEQIEKDTRRIYNALQKKKLTPARAEILLREIGVGKNLGVVYPLMVKRGAEANMAKRGRSARIDAGEYYDEATDSYIEGPMAQAWGDALKTFEYYGVEPPDEIYELVSSGGTLDEVWDAVAKSRREFNAYDPDTGDPITKEGLASQVVKELGANTVTHPTEFRNPDLNIAGEHTIALQPSGIVRSRFAAFDPAEADSPDLLKKKGGPVSMDAMRLAVGGMAGGGKAGMAKKSIEEIKRLFEAAQKTRSKAAQEAAGLYHPIGGGVKLSTPVELMSSKTVPDPSVKPVERRIITPEQMQGGVAIPLIGDRAAAARILTEMGGVQLPRSVRLQGGPGFMQTHTLPDDESAAWASGPGVISRLSGLASDAAELAGTEKVYAPYVAMSPTGVDFNTMVTQAVLNKYDPASLTKKAKKEFLRDVRNFVPDKKKPHIKPGSVLTEDDLNDVEALRAKMMPPDAGPLRKVFVQRMGTSKFQNQGFPNVAAARVATTEPELMNVDVGSTGYNIARINPEGKIIQSPKIPHETYPEQLSGEYFGSLKEPVSYQEFFPGFIEAQRLYGKPEKHDWYTFGRTMPIQTLDQEWVDRMMGAGKKPREWKKGGPVKKVSGGEITADDLIVEERSL